MLFEISDAREDWSHHNTHIDFLIYNKISKIPLLAVEVDGYKYHKKDNKQKERDILKNNISLIRLMIAEENIIRSKLDEIVDNNINIYTYIFLVWINVLINDKSI